MRNINIFSKFAATAILTVGSLSVVADSPIPTNLPRPSETPAATNKPVKVYILSGQSNMVGFGKLKGGGLTYSSIYLSADPSVRPCKMPVGSSALLPHAVYQGAKGEALGAKAFVYKGAYDPAVNYAARKPAKASDIALGTVSEKLPAIDGPHTVVVKAYIEVPMSGAHEIHAGYEDSSYAVALLEGKEVYSRKPGEEPKLAKVMLEAGKRYPITISYMQGGMASFWMERVDLKPKGSLEDLLREGQFSWVADDDGKWMQRNDVIFCDAYLGKGRSTPLSPTANGRNFGPELGFGYIMGTFHDEPVLLIKSCTGNRSLSWDYLPPNSERYEIDGMVYAGYKDSQASWAVGEEPKQGGWYAGKQYDDCTEAIHKVLDNFDEKFPQYKDQGYEIAGFVWWQGHKDQNDAHAARYEHNLVNLIKAWRKEFDAPDAKWTIATIAFKGWELAGAGKAVAEAQLAVSGETGRHPEFKGNVKTIEARNFWRGPGVSPTGKGYHYNHNAETYMLVGDALGRAMVELMDGDAEPGPVTSRPPAVPDKPVEELTLQEMSRLIYNYGFMYTWANDAREPTAEQMKAMAPAMRSFMMDGAIPEFLAAAPKVRDHKRRTLQLIDVVQGLPNRWSRGPGSEIDTLIGYYNTAGIHDYDWKPFGPDMQNTEWYYYSFDPPEKLDKGKSNRYRDITLPQGMENWYAKDFDPSAAGWKQGQAPFGQHNGELVPLSSKCSNPQCGCSIPPKTLWEKEVLLMRQTFELPRIQEGRCYRLIVGGSAHTFSGEGYALYVNGKLISESKTGFFKRGGTRGIFLDNDLLQEFQDGEVTIAAKSFLRTTRWIDRPSPTRGHLSVWLEEATLPEIVTDSFGEVNE